MSYLEMINPNYLDLIEPLRTWKILCVEDLKKLSGFEGGASSFYKAITKLEKAKLIEGFADSFTNQKYLYLKEHGFLSLGLEKMIPIHSENRFHDAHLVKLLLRFKSLSFVQKTLLDHEIKKEFPLLKHLPDALIVGKKKEEFRLAIELELHQKSKERIRETFETYEASPFFNNVLYFFQRATPFKTYQEVLKEMPTVKNKDRYIFVFEPKLTLKNYELLHSKSCFKGEETTLQEIFSL